MLELKQIALVTEVSNGTAKVSVLRKEACSACSGRYFCGSSKKAVSEAIDPIGVKVGDTVTVESKSSTVLGYAAMLFVMPIILAAVLYSVLCDVNAALAAISAVAGFVLPYIAALIIEKKTKVTLPVITRVEAEGGAETDFGDCPSRRKSDDNNG